MLELLQTSEFEEVCVTVHPFPMMVTPLRPEIVNDVSAVPGVTEIVAPLTSAASSPAWLPTTTTEHTKEAAKTVVNPVGHAAQLDWPVDAA